MNTIEWLLIRVGAIVVNLISIVGALAVLAFFWGLTKFIVKSGDEKGREEGKQIMKWGLIAIFVMFSIWGIITFFQRNIFGPNVPSSMNIPFTLPGSSS